MSAPFFSIVLPTYNRAHLIGDTIKSVLNQSFKDWELIIIDDGSSDKTGAIVSEYPDKRVNYFWQENTERSRARNAGINKASGKFICFLDSDDHWRKGHLELISKKIESLEAKTGLYFTGMTWNFPDRKQDVIFPSPEGQNPIEYTITNQLAPSTVSIHHEILQQYRFNPALIINEDVELFARIAESYPLIQIPEITVDYFVHTANTKALEKNYITPQLAAMEIIFSTPGLKDKISPDFKRNRIRDLRHQLINNYLNIGEYSAMNKEIVRFLALYPLHFQNKSKIALLLYQLPGGKQLQKLVRKLKQ